MSTAKSTRDKDYYKAEMEYHRRMYYARKWYSEQMEIIHCNHEHNSRVEEYRKLHPVTIKTKWGVLFG